MAAEQKIVSSGRGEAEEDDLVGGGSGEVVEVLGGGGSGEVGEEVEAVVVVIGGEVEEEVEVGGGGGHDVVLLDVVNKHVGGGRDEALVGGKEILDKEVTEVGGKKKIVDNELVGGGQEIFGVGNEVVGDGDNNVICPVHLDDFILGAIAVRLPTEHAHAWSLVARTWRHHTRAPSFFKRHIVPRTLAVGEEPAALLVQPRKPRPGYVHLFVIGLDAEHPISIKLRPHQRFQAFAPAHPPAAVEATPRDALLVDFFKRNLLRLDFSVVASHDKMVLTRSPTAYYVCFPAANRCLKLPAPPVMPNADTAYAFHYVVDIENWEIEFRVVVLVRCRRRRLVVHNFRSGTGVWETSNIGVGTHGAARCLGPASTGICSNGKAFLLSGGRRHGRILCYDEGVHRVSVFREPPLLKGWTRQGRSLGSVEGNLRFSAYDTLNKDPDNVLPHFELKGVYKTWILCGNGGWTLDHQEERKGVSSSFFGVPQGAELPLDIAGASHFSCFFNQNQKIFRRDVVSDTTLFLCDLNTSLEGTLGKLYNEFDVFPLFH